MTTPTIPNPASAAPPPPPGYTSADVVPTSTQSAPPPPPGYSASQVVPAETAPASTPAPQSTPMPATMSPVPEPTTVAGKVAQWADDFTNDLRHGTGITAAGRALKKLHVIAPGGMDAGVDPRVTDFIASLPLGMLHLLKGQAEEMEPGQRWQGLKDETSGALQASTIPSAFVAPDAAEVASTGVSRAGEIAGDLGSEGKELAGRAVQAVKRPFSLKAVQEALANSKAGIQQNLADTLGSVQGNWHQAVRDLFNGVAQEAGVDPDEAESLHDVAENVADALKSKASTLYKKLDQAVGGTRFQNWDEQIANVKRALRLSAGIDPDADGRLVERINQLEDARAAGLAQAKANGVDPKLIDTANATHRQAMALYDLSKQIRSSLSGLRADLADGVNAEREALSPAKLAPKANRLYDTGRLQQAVGDERADDLLRSIESAKQQAKDAAENAVKQTEAEIQQAEQKASAVKTRRTIGAAAAGSVGAGSALEWLKHLVGE